ncbi:MAG: HAMP domain-containing histidine kinase [Sphingobacteriales bacterium]|nr:HAMP domain-containing histidine kinase [Sphingobacteriales bacterium]MBI3720474.1 HAMP domain-containing histidine kinase [Sphingobacteriales bacterium]
MKLLQKTIRSYFIYSVIILLIAVPVFYYVIQGIVREDIDEDLLNTKELLKPKISDALRNNSIDQLKFLDHDITVSVTSASKEFDTLTTVEIFDTIAKELVPHRLLTSYFTVNGKPCMLQVKTSLVDNDDLIASIVKVQVILLILLMTGLFIINRNLSKKIWMPFYITLQKLQNYKVEKHAPLSLPKSSITEFNDLNTSLQELTDRTHQSFVSQKEFSENASHEMQTPLAVFQSKLELLMQTTPLTEEQALLMGDMADVAQRMARLNKSLVLLTKIENSQFADKENVSIKVYIEKFILLYQPQINEKQITVDNKIVENEILHANAALIEILINNLIGNAIRHNIVGGSIGIKLHRDRLIIENTGKAYPLDKEKIFQRFQKESTDNNSIGLGLEMVKKVCNINNYIITYDFVNKQHCFTIVFNNSTIEMQSSLVN